jgi:hypothetical protein
MFPSGAHAPLDICRESILYEQSLQQGIIFVDGLPPLVQKGLPFYTCALINVRTTTS